MSRRTLARLARMDAREIAFRSRSAARVATDRIRAAIAAPRWRRRSLLRRLGAGAHLQRVRESLASGRWDTAHRELMRHVCESPQHFVIGFAAQQALAARIRREFPDSVVAATLGAARILEGEYDLLGYRGLRFERPAGPASIGRPDWHLDPVHNRRPPRRFWASVPYLDPACGDHKIVWELNRHQHWLALGRAFWLTGEVTFRTAFVRELESWLEDNPPLVGINWASMLELALRSLSWIWAMHFFAEIPAPRDPTAATLAPAFAKSEAPWMVDLLLGLDVQLTQIERNLSCYFSPNTHLLGEALALYVAGRALPLLRRSDRRAAIGRDLLVREIDRQIAEDGGHCEQSTYYHKYTLDFYLLALAIARLTGDPVLPRFEDAVRRLASAARLLADDRGRLPHFGDDDGGALLRLTDRPADDVTDSLAAAAALTGRPDLAVGPAGEEAYWLLGGSPLAGLLEAAAVSPATHPPRSTALPDTGYYVSRSAHGDHLVVDGGPHGFQNGGHAHADALSLTFAPNASPLLIDPGTACYTVDPALRDRFRSSAMHNTLVVDDRPQSIPVGSFHWARTATTVVHRWQAAGGFDYFDGEHDGYAPIRHRRRVLNLHDDLLIVADLVTGGDGRRASVLWHVDPGWHVELRGRRAAFIQGVDRVELAVADADIEAFCADDGPGLGWYSPRYGRVAPATTLRVTRTGAGPVWIASVFGLNPSNAVVSVNTVPVWAEAGALAESTALRIEREESVDYFLVAEPAARAGSASPTARSTWRVADFETDAIALLCRLQPGAPPATLAVVGGGIVWDAGRPAHAVHSTAHDAGASKDQASSCAESPAS